MRPMHVDPYVNAATVLRVVEREWQGILSAIQLPRLLGYARAEVMEQIEREVRRRGVEGRVWS